MKKRLKWILIGVSVLALATLVQMQDVEAAETEANYSVEDIDFDTILQGGDTISLEGIDLSKEHIETSDGTIIETVSRNEMIEGIAESQGITLEEAITKVGNVSNPSLLRASPYFYKHLVKTLDVTFAYKPKIDIYVQMWSQGSFRQFNQVLDFNLNRNCSGLTKQFTGKFDVKFIDKNNIYWVVNGDFYNNGLTTLTGGGSIPLKKQGSVSFSISKASSHYKYFYNYGHIYAQ